MDYRKRIAEMRRAKAAGERLDEVLVDTKDLAREERKNVYVCATCRHATITIDRDEGVTPFMIGCEKCHGTACSTMYRAVTLLAPTIEWYRPDSDELATLSPYAQEHVKRGGLINRPIQGEDG